MVTWANAARLTGPDALFAAYSAFYLFFGP
jgi:hypothetical protein